MQTIALPGHVFICHNRLAVCGILRGKHDRHVQIKKETFLSTNRKLSEYVRVIYSGHAFHRHKAYIYVPVNLDLTPVDWLNETILTCNIRNIPQAFVLLSAYFIDLILAPFVFILLFRGYLIVQLKSQPNRIGSMMADAGHHTTNFEFFCQSRRLLFKPDLFLGHTLGLQYV
jgi:hypothetical protein